jgi:hypothetical protein
MGLREGAAGSEQGGGRIAFERGDPTVGANRWRLYNIGAAALLALVALWMVLDIRAAWLINQPLDDAYMFVRYATNIRHGLGISWNPNGVHTYGQTSLLWCGVVTAFSYLPISAGKTVILAARLSSIGAFIATAWAVATNARSGLLSSTWRVLPLVVVPLAMVPVFHHTANNGMETMLAALLCAVYVGLGLEWQRGIARPELIGLVGVLMFLARPESTLVAVLFPLLLFVFMRGVRKESLARLFGVFFAGMLLDLVACKLYFHTALPLSFYMKGWHGYKGYVFSEDWYPELHMLAFLANCSIYLLALVFLSRREDRRLIVCCITPLIAVMAYLQTVLQISGGSSRYYVPYFPLLVIPALLVVDRLVVQLDPAADTPRVIPAEGLWCGQARLWGTAVICVGSVVVLCLFVRSGRGVLASIARAENKVHYGYDPVQLEIAAHEPLPVISEYTIIREVTDLLVAPLPRGTTVAASEVGYLGSSAPQVNIIDLEGLNDAQSALQGFDRRTLLARKPDLIWMPHYAYTYQRGVMMSDPELFREYEVYAQAGDFGLAVRKDSPYRQQIDRQMQVFWDSVYPRYRMSDYIARSASWTGQAHRVWVQ